MDELKANIAETINDRKNTKVCVSIASRPGSFGEKFHNKGYEHLGLSRIYIPLCITPDDFPSIIHIVRRNFSGCSVSMPYKVEVIEYLDKLDRSAKLVGAVNTIVNHAGVLCGHNTDYDVVQSPLETHLIKEAEKSGKITIPGRLMCVYQAAKQFQLYTGKKTPPQIIQESLTWGRKSTKKQDER